MIYLNHYERREKHRPIPLWMMINIYRGKCWCGAACTLPFNSKYSSQNPAQRACGKKLGIHRNHHSVWNQYIRCWWVSFRLQFLRQYPICEMCNEEKSTDVDHIRAISLGGMIWEPGNLQALCKSCHKKKTADDFKKLANMRKNKGSKMDKFL